jgi:adenine-specific DNA methylase
VREGIVGYIERGFPSETIDEIAWSESNSRKPIYHMHKWFARRVGSTFRTILLGIFLDENPMTKFYEDITLKNANGESPIILDPFMGGGTTIVEGHRLGCRTIGVDINPMAWFITKKELESVDINRLEAEFSKIRDSVESKILSFYKTVCTKGHEADTMYTFWARSVNCQSCGNEVPLFKSFIITKQKDKKTVHFCPACNEIVTGKAQCQCGMDLSEAYATNKRYHCPNCRHSGDLTEAWLSENRPPIERPYALEFYCEDCGRGYKTPDEIDLQRISDAKREYNLRKEKLVGTLIPDDEVPWTKMATMRPRCVVYKRFSDFFNSRQLLTLSMILQQILKVQERPVREFLLLTFSDTLNANNMFCIYNVHASKLEPLFGGHYFSPPTTPVENNVWGTKVGRGSFSRYFAKGIRALRYQQSPFEIRFTDDQPVKGRPARIRERVAVGDRIEAQFADSFKKLQRRRSSLLKCQSSEDLAFIPDKAIDAVVTDPPYYDNIMYSELSDFFYVWLRRQLKTSYPSAFGRESSNSPDEILVYTKTGKDADFFINSMTRVYSELHRVMNDDAKLVFVYQHKRLKAWTAMLQILVNTGFYVEAVYPTHGETPSGVRAHGINHNALLVCRKVSDSALSTKKQPRTAAVEGLGEKGTTSLMLELGKALAAYSQYPSVLDGKITDDCIKDFESYVRDNLMQ